VDGSEHDRAARPHVAAHDVDEVQSVGARQVAYTVIDTSPAQVMDAARDVDAAQDIDARDINAQDIDTVQVVEAAVPRGEQTLDLAPETPILAAMLAGWQGPAASVVGHNLARAEPEPVPAPAQPTAPAPCPTEPERPSPIRVRVGGNGRAPLVIASGELSESTADQLATPVQLCLLTRPRRVGIDLSGITAVTHGAVTTLLGLREAAHANDSDLELWAASRPVLEVLDSTGTYGILKPRRTERPEPVDPALRRPDVDGAVPFEDVPLKAVSFEDGSFENADVEAEVLDGDAAGGKPKRSGERPPKGHRRAARLRRPPQVA